MILMVSICCYFNEILIMFSIIIRFSCVVWFIYIWVFVECMFIVVDLVDMVKSYKYDKYLYVKYFKLWIINIFVIVLEWIILFLIYMMEIFYIIKILNNIIYYIGIYKVKFLKIFF